MVRYLEGACTKYQMRQRGLLFPLALQKQPVTQALAV